MSERALEKLAKARAYIRSRLPYLMTTIYGFVPVWVDGIKTLGLSEGMVLSIDPEWFAELEDKKAAAAVVHEAFHEVNNHLPRMMALPDKDAANIAGDLWINPMMRAAGWELPHGVFPEMYGFKEGLTLEEYYQLLKKREQEQQKQQQQSQSGPGQTKQGQGGKGGKPDPSGAGKPGGQKADGQGGSGQPGQQPGKAGPPSPGGAGGGGGPSQDHNPHLPGGMPSGVGAGRCGGACGKSVNKDLEKKLDAEHGRSEQDRKRINKQTMDDIRQHAQAHGRGSVPAGLLQGLDVLKEQTVIRWQDHFRYILKKCTGMIEAGGMDFSLSRPSKRSPARGFPRPGMVQYQPEVALILDTSASMQAPQLIEALNEGVSVMKTLGIDQVFFLQADTQVSVAPKKVRIHDLVGKVKIHGRGGTSFDAALRAAEKLKPRPDLIVYLTDGDGHVTYRPKGIEVVWCVVRGHYNKKPCEWGHTIVIADQAAAGQARTRRTP